MKKTTLLPIIFFLLVIFFVSTVSAQNAIQVQPSSDGAIEASLVEAKIKRDVLTIKVILKNISDNSIEPEIPFEGIYYTDIEASKKYYGLKDSEGKYIAGPSSRDWRGGVFKHYIKAHASKILWIKFPAPPETTKAIDIFIPEILPFEEINIGR